jgi:hypothetical protein
MSGPEATLIAASKSGRLTPATGRGQPVPIRAGSTVSSWFTAGRFAAQWPCVKPTGTASTCGNALTITRLTALTQGHWVHCWLDAERSPILHRALRQPIGPRLEMYTSQPEYDGGATDGPPYCHHGRHGWFARRADYHVQVRRPGLRDRPIARESGEVSAGPHALPGEEPGCRP